LLITSLQKNSLSNNLWHTWLSDWYGGRVSNWALCTWLPCLQQRM